MASFSKYKTTKGEFWMIRLYLTNPITLEKKLTTRRGFHKLSKAKQIFKEEYSTHLKASTIYRKSVDLINGSYRLLVISD